MKYYRFSSILTVFAIGLALTLLSSQVAYAHPDPSTRCFRTERKMLTGESGQNCSSRLIVKVRFVAGDNTFVHLGVSNGDLPGEQLFDFVPLNSSITVDARSGRPYKITPVEIFHGLVFEDIYAVIKVERGW